MIAAEMEDMTDPGDVEMTDVEMTDVDDWRANQQQDRGIFFIIIIVVCIFFIFILLLCVFFFFGCRF